MTDVQAMVAEWREVPGFSRYAVSSEGEVRNTLTDQKLKPGIASNGYPTITLYGDGKRKAFTVHSLVLLTFVGPRPLGAVVRHLDSNKKNNTLTNLVYGTQSENIKDSVAAGNNKQANKKSCPLGHPLVEYNLTKADRALGRRRCLACNRGHAASRRRGMQYLCREVADMEYEKILRAVKPADWTPPNIKEVLGL